MKKLIIVIVVLGVSFVGCEKVIDIPLNEADQLIVVEAVGRNFEGETYVLLSKTGSVYDDGNFEKLTGAVVTITDGSGEETVFIEDPLELGRYTSATFQTTVNSNYSLTVNYDGQLLEATSTTLYEPTLDSLSYLPIIGGGFGGSGDDTTFLVFYNFVDNIDEANYYRVQLWVNGVADDNFYIGDDALGNGNNVSAPFFASTIEPRDTVYVELQSMDEVAYTYLSTLSSNLDVGPFSATPANPVTNIENGIGYFSTYMIDTMTIIMP